MVIETVCSVETGQSVLCVFTVTVILMLVLIDGLNTLILINSISKLNSLISFFIVCLVNGLLLSN